MISRLAVPVPVSLTSKAPPADKANFPHPHGLAVNEAWHQHVTEVHAKAGDVVIFCEAYESCTVSMMHLQKQQLSAQN